jgi:hypothetical protein
VVVLAFLTVHSNPAKFLGKFIVIRKESSGIAVATQGLGWEK